MNIGMRGLGREGERRMGRGKREGRGKKMGIDQKRIVKGRRGKDLEEMRGRRMEDE